MDMASDVLQPMGEDTARISWNLRKKIAEYQETFSVIERVRLDGCRHARSCYTTRSKSPVIFLFCHDFVVSKTGCCGRPWCLYWRR